jgi:hypothetical protein
VPSSKAASWLAADGTRGSVISTAPWRRGGRAYRPIDETRELLVDGHVVDPEQVDIWEAADELDTEARHPDEVPHLTEQCFGVDRRPATSPRRVLSGGVEEGLDALPHVCRSAPVQRPDQLG